MKRQKKNFFFLIRIFQTNDCVVIKDIKPVSSLHILVLSHKHIQNAKSLKPCQEDRDLRKYKLPIVSLIYTTFAYLHYS